VSLMMKKMKKECFFFSKVKSMSEKKGDCNNAKKERNCY
jgi:hypothetical protein